MFSVAKNLQTQLPLVRCKRTRAVIESHHAMSAVTIVIPIYNNAAFLKRLVEQLESQTFRDFEVAFICDQSPDGSETVLPEVLRRVSFPCESIIREEKGSAGSARDYALDHGMVRGEFVLFLDADDRFPVFFLEKLYEKAMATKADMVVCAYERVDAATGAIISREMAHYPERLTVSEPTLQLALINPAPWNKLIRVSCIRDVRFIAPYFEDAMFLIKLLPLLDSIAFIPEPLYQYMVYPESTIATTDESRLPGSRRSFLETREYFRTHPETHGKMFDLLVAFIFLRYGIGQTTRACLAASSWKDVRRISRETRSFFYAEFPDWPHSPLLRHKVLIKLGFKGFLVWRAKTLIRMNWFPLFVWEYKVFTRVLKKDIKW